MIVLLINNDQNPISYLIPYSRLNRPCNLNTLVSTAVTTFSGKSVGNEVFTLSSAAGIILAKSLRISCISSSDCKILKNVVSEVLLGLFSKLEIVACLMPIFSPTRSASSRFAGEPVSLHSPIALGYRSSESSSCHTSTANLSA